jgi:hypothetical protein
MRARGMLLVGIAAGALTMSASAASADTLDQQQTDTSSPTPAYVTGPMTGPSSSAVTFTAGLSGALDRADLSLDCFVCSNTTGVTVQIRDTSAGAPGTNVLATASIPAASVPMSPVFIPVAFNAPATVHAGTQYAIVAFVASGSDTYRWRAAAGTPYSGGRGFSSGATPPPTSWNPATVTPAFKTYVIPTASQTPGTTGPTGQRAAALAKCKHKHGKKRKKCKKRANLLPV